MNARSTLKKLEYIYYEVAITHRRKGQRKATNWIGSWDILKLQGQLAALEVHRKCFDDVGAPELPFEPSLSSWSWGRYRRDTVITTHWNCIIALEDEFEGFIVFVAEHATKVNSFCSIFDCLGITLVHFYEVFMDNLFGFCLHSVAIIPHSRLELSNLGA